MKELTRDVKVNETKYLLVYDKLQSLELEKLSLSPKMTVLDSAYIPFNHIAPQRKLIVTLTFAASFAGSCLILFIFFIIKENRGSEVSA